jgi:hypothetical protein
MSRQMTSETLLRWHRRLIRWRWAYPTAAAGHPWTRGPWR